DAARGATVDRERQRHHRTGQCRPQDERSWAGGSRARRQLGSAWREGGGAEPCSLGNRRLGTRWLARTTVAAAAVVVLAGSSSAVSSERRSGRTSRRGLVATRSTASAARRSS